MRIVWAYRDLDQRKQSPLHMYSFNQFLLKASVQSTIKFAPEYERVFYVDLSIYNLLGELGIRHYWDRVEIVDFERELFIKRHSPFFAMPKIWAYTQQEEPFWILDTDVLFTEDLGSWFNERLGDVWADSYDYYDLNKKGPFDTSILKMYDSKLVFPRKSIVGAPIFYSNPEIAKIIGHTILDLNVTDLSRFSDEKNKIVGNVQEEGVLGGLFKVLKLTVQPVGSQVNNTVDKSSRVVWHIPLDGNIENYSDYVKEVLHILGENIE